MPTLTLYCISLPIARERKDNNLMWTLMSCWIMRLFGFFHHFPLLILLSAFIYAAATQHKQWSLQIHRASLLAYPSALLPFISNPKQNNTFNFAADGYPFIRCQGKMPLMSLSWFCTSHSFKSMQHLYWDRLYIYNLLSALKYIWIKYYFVQFSTFMIQI